MSNLYLDVIDSNNFSVVECKKDQTVSVERDGKTYTYSSTYRHSAWDQPGIWNTIRGIWNFIMCHGFTVVDDVYLLQRKQASIVKRVGQFPNQFKTVNFFYYFCDHDKCCKHVKKPIDKHHVTIVYLENSPSNVIVKKVGDIIEKNAKEYFLADKYLEGLTYTLGKEGKSSTRLNGKLEDFIEKIRVEVFANSDIRPYLSERTYPNANFGVHFNRLNNTENILKAVDEFEVKVSFK